MLWDINLTDLKDALAELYTKEDDYRAVARESELNEGKITFTGKAGTAWSEILNEAQKQNKVLNIIKRVRKDYASNKAFQIAAEQYIQNLAEQRDSRVFQKTLPKEIITTYDNYIKVLQAKDEVIHWYDAFTKAKNALTVQSGISPEQCEQVQQSLYQLNDLLTGEYRLLEENSDLRDFFGQDCYDLMKILSSIDEQSRNLITKIQVFKPISNIKSMIALDWQLDIQQNMLDILRNLQKIDYLFQPFDPQATRRGETRVVDAKDVYQLSSLDTSIQPEKPNQFEEATVAPALEALEKIDETDLCEAIFRFYKIDDLITLCSNLSITFDDQAMEYEKLSGRTPQLRIMALIELFKNYGRYRSLIQHLRQIPHFDNMLSQVIQKG